MNSIKKYFEVAVVVFYTFFTLKIIFPFLLPLGLYGVRELNNNLTTIVFGIFLNVALIIYCKILPKKVEIFVLVVYTVVNFKLLAILLPITYLYTPGDGILLNTAALNYLGLFVGLFLNATTIFYWLRNNTK